MEANIQAIPENIWMELNMRDEIVNPFNITKAVDFSDKEIFAYWVDFSDAGGLFERAKPTSPMPMLILGGKGSGKTHLMRYFSCALQAIRHRTNITQGLKEDGYVGIYFRCGGLNSARFKGKRQSDDEWIAVFAYYMELWLAQVVLMTILDSFKGSDELKENEKSISKGIAGLFADPSIKSMDSIAEIQEYLQDLQRNLDFAVNNCAITGCLKVEITVTHGKLVFGIPKILSSNLPTLEESLFVYLIDEFENLSETQQKYVNTLIREKESPCSFKVGARLYGVRTYKTYSADEENKDGSEFETLKLDDFLRENDTKYREFAKKLIMKRLSENGYAQASQLDQQKRFPDYLSYHFEEPKEGKFSKELTLFVDSTWKNRERPYFQALRKKLGEGRKRKLAPGISTEKDIDLVISHLQCPEYPLLEKFNILLLYKDWQSNKNLIASAESIKSDCQNLKQNKSPGERYKAQMEHFKTDMIAQLRRDCAQKQVYAGVNTLIDMSWGLPKNLLVLLKCGFEWAVFYGERPFRDRPLTIEAQQAGVSEATDWFFRDARMIGRDGNDVQASVNKLGTLLRRIRFSDKPSECSITAFSADLSQSSSESRRIIDLAQKWSLLIRVGIHKDKNTGRIDEKIQLNRMLAPRWDLSIFRRGTISLSPDEINAIFDKECEKKFEDVFEDRVARMMAPAFKRERLEKRAPDKDQFAFRFKND